ncbi:hypothetical protein [Gilliamella sp. wkB171]|uniref:hypothetical protein n=1 Tax=Gilliamella sp. wkB171 TaxID=3120258 RepID=UPI00117A4396|nr:hypothetical protein [Gilliamella apicola]
MVVPSEKVITDKILASVTLVLPLSKVKYGSLPSMILIVTAESAFTLNEQNNNINTITKKSLKNKRDIKENKQDKSNTEKNLELKT